jgi:FKBP-type peptidyl-prolyl cis-trans isomerase
MAGLFLAACSNLTAPPTPEPIASETAQAAGQPSATAPGAPSAAPSGSQAQQPPQPAPVGKVDIKEVLVGKGPEAKQGDKVNVLYTGKLTDGKEFDSSAKHGNKPFTFTLGSGGAIQGWHQGIAGMHVGGKRTLTIPPSLGYGDRGFPPVIPPNATLIFDVELKSIEPK